MLAEINLRPYQEKAVGEIRIEYRNGARCVLFVLPTGGGKTFTFSFIADSAMRKGGRVLILAHRQELVMQASLSLAKLGVEHSLIASPGKCAAIKVQHVRELGKCLVRNSSHVMVGSIQTAIRRLPTIPKPTLIILDEAHHAIAGQWRELIEYFKDSKVLGVTATPCRSDEQGLGSHVGGVFDSMVIGPSMADLISMGNLVPPKIYMPGTVSLSGLRRNKDGDVSITQLAEKLATEKPTIVGDAVEQYKSIAHGKRAVVFCASVKAAQASAEAFVQAGFNFRSLDGTMDDCERRDVVAMLGDGRIDGITSCDIVSEGFDCPGLEVAILLRPTASESLYLQQVGRVLRPSEGKEFGIVIDHVGNVERFGPPNWVREWSLDGGLIRKNGIGPNDKTPLIRTCPMCFSVHDPMPKCPECGHLYVIKERKIAKVAGKLVEMTPEIEAQIVAKRDARKEQGSAQTLEDLKRIEQARGYKKGWAQMVFGARKR